MAEGGAERRPRQFAARGEQVLDDVARRSKITLETRWRRLRATSLMIVQVAFAAAAAWWIARSVLGHETPFFAPIAAAISLGVSVSQRLRRATEIVVGVALGILVGDLIVSWIGSGTWQIAVVVALAMSAAVFLGGGPLVIGQAASSGVLVTVLTPPTAEQPITYDRFLDALIGGAVGLLISVVLLPVNPISAAKRHINTVLDELAGILGDLARALAERDADGADAALQRARETEKLVDQMRDGLTGSEEVARLAPARWRARDELETFLRAVEPLDLALRNARVLARSARGMLRAGEEMPTPELPAAVDGLAVGVQALRRELASGQEPVRARRLFVSAGRIGTDAAHQSTGFLAPIVAGLLRPLSVDLLVATGLERDDAVAALPDVSAS